MTPVSRLACLGLAALFLVTPIGCGGGSNDATSSGQPSGKDALSDFASLLKELKVAGKRAPLRVADLGDADATNPAGTGALTRGEITYFWGNGIGEGQAVIAYGKEVPTAGGFVLLQDGTVKTMTAAEFAAAPKAAKK